MKYMNEEQKKIIHRIIARDSFKRKIALPQYVRYSNIMKDLHTKLRDADKIKNKNERRKEKMRIKKELKYYSDKRKTIRMPKRVNTLQYIIQPQTIQQFCEKYNVVPTKLRYCIKLLKNENPDKIISEDDLLSKYDFFYTQNHKHGK